MDRPHVVTTHELERFNDRARAGEGEGYAAVQRALACRNYHGQTKDAAAMFMRFQVTTDHRSTT